MDERLARAVEASERAMFEGDDTSILSAHSELDAVEADLCLARGKLLHAQFLKSSDGYPAELFERAAQLYARLGDDAKPADALFRVGLYQQVVRGDHATALPHFHLSRELAEALGDKLILSYVVRHLGFAAMHTKDWASAYEQLEYSVSLRREIGFVPGVAAGLLALASLAHQTGDAAAESAYLDEALAVARACGAKGIEARVIAARQESAG